MPEYQTDRYSSQSDNFKGQYGSKAAHIMYKSTLIDFCRQLTRKEMSKFLQMAHSPLHNKHQAVTALVKYLDKIYPDFSEKKTTEESLNRAIRKNLPKKAFVLKHVSSYTLKLLERLFILEELEKAPVESSNLLLKALRNRQHNKRFENKLNKHLKLIENIPERNAAYHYHNFALKSEVDLYYLRQAPYRRDENLQTKVNSLDKYFMSEKLRSACEMINRTLFLNVSYDFHLLDEITKHIRDRIDYFQSIPSIIIYYHIYLTLTEAENPKHYQRIKELLNNFGHQFPREELRNIYLYKYNYCLRQVNKGSQAFLQETFLLIQEFMDKQILLDQGLLYEGLYKNAVSIGLRLRQFDWTKNFIYEYKEMLLPAVADNAFNFCLSSFYYESQQYDLALALLNEVEYTDIVYTLDAKSLLLRIYYQLEEEESFRSHFAAFQKFLRRNKLIAKPKYDRYHNLFRYTQLCFHLKTRWDFQSKTRSRAELQRLKQQIEDEKSISNRGWLKTRLQELEQRLG